MSTPIPWPRVLVVVACIFGDALNMMLAFPFVPFMVRDFFGSEREASVAAYAGLLAGTYKLGQFVVAPCFGYLADRFGRRLPMLLSMALGPLPLLLFAVAPTFGWAFAWRFVQGATCGSMTIGKVYLADITDKSNEARVFSCVGLAMGLGAVVGPTLGGALSRPAEQYILASASGRLFARFPYLLPCLVSACFSVTTLLFACVLLEESQLGARTGATRVGMGVATEPLIATTAELAKQTARALPVLTPPGGGGVHSVQVACARGECAADRALRPPPSCHSPPSAPRVAEPARECARALPLSRSSSHPLLSARALGYGLGYGLDGVIPLQTADWRRADGIVVPTSLELARALAARLTRATPLQQAATRGRRRSAEGCARHAAQHESPVRTPLEHMYASVTGDADEPRTAAGDALVQRRWRRFGLVQLVQLLFALTGNGYAEVFPVRMSASRADGGYGLSARAIGAAQAVGGLSLLLVVLAVFFPIVRTLGVLRAMRVGLLANALVFTAPLALDLGLRSCSNAAPTPAPLAAAPPAAALTGGRAGVQCGSGGVALWVACALTWAVRAFALNMVWAPRCAPARRGARARRGLTRRAARLAPRARAAAGARGGIRRRAARGTDQFVRGAPLQGCVARGNGRRRPGDQPRGDELW